MGFKISEIVQGSKYKNLMKYVYGWGASIVLLGALFKIQHYPGAGIMLLVGMCTEAVIFFLSAFEPIVEEVDWSLVYPELAGLDEGKTLAREDSKKKSDFDMGLLESVITSAISKSNINVAASSAANTAASAGVASSVSQQPVVQTVSGGNAGMVFTEKFNEMLEKAQIGPELFVNIRTGLERLSEASNGISKISAAVAATEGLSANISRASDSVGKFATNYENSGAILSRTAKVLADSFEKTSSEVEGTGKAFSASFKDIVQQAANRLSSASDDMGKGIADASSQIVAINKNLAALNAAHDAQIQDIQSRLKTSDEANKKLEEMLRQMLSQATENTSRYSQSVSQLADNVSRLNSVYGNMLSAMGTLVSR